jgi:hypothetical protein
VLAPVQVIEWTGIWEFSPWLTERYFNVEDTIAVGRLDAGWGKTADTRFQQSLRIRRPFSIGFFFF